MSTNAAGNLNRMKLHFIFFFSMFLSLTRYRWGATYKYCKRKNQRHNFLTWKRSDSCWNLKRRGCDLNTYFHKMCAILSQLCFVFRLETHLCFSPFNNDTSHGLPKVLPHQLQVSPTQNAAAFSFLLHTFALIIALAPLLHFYLLHMRSSAILLNICPSTFLGVYLCVLCNIFIIFCTIINHLEYF